MPLKIDKGRLLERVKKEHADYLENDNISPAQMMIEMEQHSRGKCFPTCFFCKVDRTALAELLEQNFL